MESIKERTTPSGIPLLAQTKGELEAYGFGFLDDDTAGTMNPRLCHKDGGFVLQGLRVNCPSAVRHMEEWKIFMCKPPL